MKFGEHIDSYVDDYVDGNLDEPTRQSVELHASTCARCQEMLDGFSSLRQQADRLPPVIGTPADLWQSIEDAITDKSAEATSSHDTLAGLQTLGST